MVKYLRRKFPGLSKSPIWPALLSGLVVPGLGQIVNRELGKGIFLITASVGSLLWFGKYVTEHLGNILTGTPEQWSANPEMMREGIQKLLEQNSSVFLTFQMLFLLIWIFGVVDAYLTAKNPKPIKAQGDDRDTEENDYEER